MAIGERCVSDDRGGMFRSVAQRASTGRCTSAGSAGTGVVRIAGSGGSTVDGFFDAADITCAGISTGRATRTGSDTRAVRGTSTDVS